MAERLVAHDIGLAQTGVPVPQGDPLFRLTIHLVTNAGIDNEGPSVGIKGCDRT
jgi:hypothetical protein